MYISKEYLSTIKITPLLDTLKLQKIDDEEYFSAKYNNYISNSRLSLINPDQENDPVAFFEGLSKHNKYSEALLLGSAVHCMTLQPESFCLSRLVSRPSAKLGFMADELYKVYSLNKEITSEDVIEASNRVNYYKDKMTDEKIDMVINSCRDYWEEREKELSTKIPIYLDLRLKARASESINAVKRNQLMQKLLHPEGIIENPESENEQAILLDVQMEISNKDPFIFKLKAKLDNYTIDTEMNVVTVNDLKTIGKIVSAFSDNFKRFHYARELAIYTWLMSLVAKKYYNMDNPTFKSNCLVVSTIPSYYTKIYSVSKDDFIEGWEEFKYLLRLAAYYYGEGYRFDL